MIKDENLGDALTGGLPQTGEFTAPENILTDKDKERMLNQFKKDSKDIDTSIKNFVITKLNEYFK